MTLKPKKKKIITSDKIPQPKKLMGEKIYLSSQFTGVILPGRESRQGLEAVGHVASTPRKQGATH